MENNATRVNDTKMLWPLVEPYITLLVQLLVVKKYISVEARNI